MALISDLGGDCCVGELFSAVLGFFFFLGDWSSRPDGPLENDIGFRGPLLGWGIPRVAFGTVGVRGVRMDPVTKL